MAMTLSHKTNSQAWFRTIVSVCGPATLPATLGFIGLHEGDPVLAHLPTPPWRRGRAGLDHCVVH